MSAQASSRDRAGVAPADRLLSQTDTQLAIRYRRTFMAVVLPLLGLVLALAITQYRSQRAQVLRDVTQHSANHVAVIEPLFRSALDHVQRIRHRFESYLPNPPVYLKSRPEYFTPRIVDGRLDGYTFDSIPEALRTELGQLVWFDRTHPDEATADQAIVDQALDFFSLARLAHAQNAHFHWTYFFSADQHFINIYPWIPSRQMIGDRANYARTTPGPAWRETPVYAHGLPERNPDGREYWVGPYLDTAGAGHVVTAAAPVYVEGKFKGVAATDVRLRAIHQLLLELQLHIGRVLLLGDEGTLVADSARAPGSVWTNVVDVLSPELRLGDIQAAGQSPGRPHAAGGHTLIARHVPQTPWTLVYLVSDKEINAQLLPNFIPYLIIVLAVSGAFLLVLWLMRREFIEPAFRLVQYIQRETRQEEAAVPPVPRLWQPWVEAVAGAFQSNREATRKLRDSEVFKSAILENAMLGVITIDPADRIVDFNPAAERMFATTRSAMSGRGFLATVVAPASRERCLQLWACFRDVGTLFPREHRIEIQALRADGSEIPVALSVSATGRGEARFLTVFVADLTEQKSSEEQLARQREALRQSEKMSAMGALLAGVAHELNNPLAILMGRAALLEGKLAEPAHREIARRIYAAAERCGRIVRMFLSMARQRPPERRLTQLNDVAAGALELMGYGLRSAGIDIVASFDSVLPAVNMDADQIGQVAVNLIVNAQQALADRRCDALQRREIRIETRLHGDSVELRVSDNGPGVPHEIAQRIFDPFFTTKPAGTGTGVGLAVSLAIAREHRGDLRLVPSDAGAVFVLSLPLGTIERQPSQRLPAQADESLFAGHALIIDDEAEVTDVLGEILESAGFTTTRFSGGREALAWLQENDCDVILTDLRMPDLDGPAFWRALHEQRPELAKRIAFVTGDTLSASVEPFLRSTGLPWLEKPFTPEQVLELVASVEARA